MTSLMFLPCFGLGGLLMGAASRWLLTRLRRGVVVNPPWPELAGGLLAALAAFRHPPPTWLPVPLLLGVIAVPLAAADLACRRLPDALTLPAYPLLSVALLEFEPSLVGRVILGALAFGGAHALVRALAPGSLGGGDVKLAGALGLVLGALGWPDLIIAPVLAAATTLLLALARRAKSAPHGPGLLAATWVLAVFSVPH